MEFRADLDKVRTRSSAMLAAGLMIYLVVPLMMANLQGPAGRAKRKAGTLVILLPFHVTRCLLSTLRCLKLLIRNPRVLFNNGSWLENRGPTGWIDIETAAVCPAP